MNRPTNNGEGEMQTSIIPAAPGWFVLHDNAEGWLFGGDPVLAWEVVRVPREQRSDGYSDFIEVNPVTTAGRVDSRQKTWLLRPDGSVEETECRSWDSLDKANATEERQRRRTA